MMADIIDIIGKKATRDGEFEYCVLCWRRTDIRRDTPVHKRRGYVEGVGQLCEECWKWYVSAGEGD